MSKPPCEADLAQDADSERFGDAMVLCQDASGECASRGRCTFDGDCFKSDSIDYRRAHKLLTDLLEGARNKESIGVIVWLAHARNAMEHYRSTERRG